jgi:predicted DNA-binding transcriptional regulator AlpA
MLLHPAVPDYRPNFRTPAPEAIQLTRIKLPVGMRKSKSQPSSKPQLQVSEHTSATTISDAYGIATEDCAPAASSVDSITPDTTVEFGRTASYKKPARQPSSVSLEGDGYLRLEDVLTVYPVSRSAWYEGIKQGVYPASVPLGRRSVGWPRAAIRALVQSPPKF